MVKEHGRPQRLAVLIDADNVSSHVATCLFEKVAAIGEASVRRIYGDFSGTRLKGWSEAVSTHAIVPQQNFATTVGKNASDIALVIDAMDLLHTGRFDAFCLVSSDSDFTRLAARIREQGVDVYGFGERKTPVSFREACKRFIYTENMVSSDVAEVPPVVVAASTRASNAALPKLPPHAAMPLIHAALSQIESVNGWYYLGAVGTQLAVLAPDFDPRTYGCPKLMTLVEKSQIFEVRRNNLHIHIRQIGSA